jgi:hypothetical protein
MIIIKVRGSGYTKEFQTLVNFPPMKLLEIFQIVGSDDSTTSETFLTMLCIECHTGSAGELAEENLMMR